MVSNSVRLRNVATVGLCCLLVVGLAGVGSAQSTATELNECTTITESGSYVLAGDVTNGTADVCLDIQADNVTVDGNGAVVEGNETGVGVAVGEGVSNVTVANLTTSNWSTGVQSANASDVTVTDVTATANGNGIVYANSSTATLANSTASANDVDGVVVNGSSDTTLDRNNVTNNGDDGIDIDGSDGIVLTANTLSGNGDLPIEVTNSSNIRIQSGADAGETTPDDGPATPDGGSETAPADGTSNEPA